MLIGLISSGCGRFDVGLSVEPVEPTVATIASATPTPNSVMAQPQATVTKQPTAVETAAVVVEPTEMVEPTESAFDPYPTLISEVQAIRILDSVGMALIYSGPGENFPLAASIQSGLALAVGGVTEDGRWYQLAGCGEQNPFRPAPSCWISTDPTVAEPIPPIVPSQQPVQTTDKQAVMILAQDMASVYSGPETTYPMVAQLAGGFSFNITGISADGNWWRLEECSSPLNESLAECWISADPAITQAVDGAIPHGPQSSAPPIEDPLLRSGTTTIVELPRCFNLDAGTVGSASNPNCEFTLYSSESPGTLFFEPIRPARFGFGGVFPEAPTEAMCAGSQHLSGVGEVIAPVASFYVCYQTGEGRFGYLRFWEMTDSPLTVTMEWKTFVE